MNHDWPYTFLDRAQTFKVFGLLGISGVMATAMAVRGDWGLSGAFGGLGFLSYGLLWATQRQRQNSPRDPTARLVLIGIVVLTVITLAVLRLAP